MKTVVHCLAALLLLTPVVTRAARDKFTFETLQARARQLASEPYRERTGAIPGWLAKLSYDEYRDIRFDEMRTWWRKEKLPFQLQFFHPGGLFKHSVRINELTGGVPHEIGFSPHFFDYGRNKISGRVPSDLGFAGFRILTELNKRGKTDELAAFLGASYYRALGRGMRYGLSARGLAIDTAETGGEEFPAFEEYWIERPAPGSTETVFLALLNGPSVTGAYRFAITPGDDTVVHVKAVLFFRRQPKTLGLAPLTSMFAHGENTGWAADDFRPEVHDSDGLMMETGAGEWIWRPLLNPRAPRVSMFADSTPRGFGLFQRDREFSHYDDLEAWYHQRPSAWVEPVGDWGPGTVRLVELPTRDETNDNIVAFWTPAKLPAIGEPLLFEYRQHWLIAPAGRPPAGHVLSTRQAAVADRPGLRRFVLEFAGDYLAREPADSDIKAVVTAGETAQLAAEPVVQKNMFNGAWRVVFEVNPDGSGRPVELRAYLRKQRHALTETWSYLWNP